MRKSALKVSFDEYIDRMFPCSCASFYSERNKKDPHCFLCQNKPRIYKALTHVRERSMAEAKNICNTTSYINEKGEIILPPFVNVDKDKFFVS